MRVHGGKEREVNLRAICEEYNKYNKAVFSVNFKINTNISSFSCDYKYKISKNKVV